MAKKLSETVNKKSITPFDDLKDMLEQTANDLALVEPDPENWSDWVAYLLEVLQIVLLTLNLQISAEPVPESVMCTIFVME